MPLELIADVMLEQAIIGDPLTVSSNIPIAEAIACMSRVRGSCSLPDGLDVEPQLLREIRATCLLVMEGAQLVGILTERDVVRLSSTGQPLTEQPLADVMTRTVITLRQSEFTEFADIFTALHLLQRHHIRHLPVLGDQGQVVGLLTHGTLRHLLRPVDLLRLRLVAEIMVSQVIQATPETSVLDLARLMATHQVSSVVIVAAPTASMTAANCESSNPFPVAVGIVTEGDIVQFQALNLDFNQIQAQQVMSSPVFTVHSADSLWVAQQCMQQKRLSRLIVEGDRGELLGIVTQSTLLQAMNPIEIYKLVQVMQEKVSCLEAEKLELLQNRNIELEHQVQQRTAALRKQTERERLLSLISTRIRASLELQSTLDAIVTEVQQFLQCDRVLVYQFNPDGSGVVTAEAVLSGWQPAMRDPITDCCLQDKMHQLYVRGQKQAVSNIYEANYTDCHIALLEQYQVKANLVVPILVEEQLWGLLIGHQCESERIWETTDLELMDRIAVQVAIAIQQSQAYEHTRREIAERRQAEEALRQSEATRQAIIQAIPDLLIRTNVQGERLDFFSGGEVQVVSPPPEMEQATVFDILPEPLASRQLQYIQQALTTRHLQTYEQQIEVDQQVRWEEVRIAPLMQDEAVVIVRDITDRKQAEVAFQSLVEGAAAISGENFFAELVQYIAAVLNVRSVMVATQQGDSLQSAAFWLDGQIQPNVTYGMENTPCNRVVSLGEFVCLRRVQQQFPTNQVLHALNAEVYVGIALTDTTGESTGCLYIVDSKPLSQPERTIAMLRVFAARVSAELERQAAIDALKRLNEELEDRIARRTIELRQSEERFRQIFEQSPVGIAISDLDGNLTRVNSSLAQIVGYPKADLLQYSIQAFMTPAGQPQDVQLFQQLMEQTLSVITFESQLISGRGKMVWVNVTSALIFNAFGRPSAIIHLLEDVSDRKQAELNAESWKERLQFLLSSSPAVIYTSKVGDDYGATFISENVTALLGYEPDEFLQDTRFWISHLHPQDRERVLSELSALFNHGHHYHEYRFLHRDGDYRWMRDELRLIYNSNGEPIEIIGYFADITDLKQTELELRELTLSLQNAMEGIAHLDQQGRYLTVNWAYANLCGYEPDELVGDSWQMTVYPEDIPLLENAYQIMLERGKVEAEARGIRKDGSLFDKQVTMVVACDQEGQFSGHYCFMKDISERKRLEAERQRTEETLKRQLAAIEAAIDGIAILENNIYTYVNKAHVEMFGYQQPEELLGKTWTILYASTEIQRLEQEVFPILAQQRFWQGEAIATCKDGNTFNEGLSLTLTESGALICVCRDITKQKQAEVKIRQANEQLLLANAELARATRLKDEFLANMSHELRTPLNAVLGMAEGLQERVFGDINEAQTRAISTIDRSGKHLLELINDILDLSKIESGKLELQLAPVSVKYLCESSLTFVRQVAVRKNVQLSAEILTTAADISVDERRMRQVLINLLNNAVKFTPEGGSVQLIVSEDCQTENCCMLFQVRDTGIGIATEDFNKLFQPFIQIDSSLTRHHSGTGLGLSLVQQLTHLHGGTVAVTSVVGQGSCFTVRIPYNCVPDVIPENFTPPLLPAVAPVTSASNKTILVIEDTPSAAEQTSRYLTEVGLQATIHPVGQGALDVAIDLQPALIILDILLPDIPGWDVLTQIKSHSQTHAIPVVIASVVDERSQAMNLGASGYLVKPANRNQLQSLLKSLHLPITIPDTAATPPTRSAIATPLIVLAEDNDANIVTLSGYLRHRGFQLILAKDGEAAIALTAAHHPDLVLMDIQMPKVDGLMAIRQIRANPAIAHIPIIALTALAMPQDREKCIEAGANEYITKPVKLKLLVEMIQRLL